MELLSSFLACENITYGRPFVRSSILDIPLSLERCLIPPDSWNYWWEIWGMYPWPISLLTPESIVLIFSAISLPRLKSKPCVNSHSGITPWAVRKSCCKINYFNLVRLVGSMQIALSIVNHISVTEHSRAKGRLGCGGDLAACWRPMAIHGEDLLSLGTDHWHHPPLLLLFCCC